MKSHFKLIYFIIWISTTSCTQNYFTQIYSTHSPSLLKSGEGWFYETDSLKIVYDFFDTRGKMNFKIYNKQKSPIYIDWKNSSFTQNGTKNTYWQGTEKSTKAGNNEQKINALEPITIIPPKSIFSSSELDTVFHLLPNYYKLDKQKAIKLMKPSVLLKNKLLPGYTLNYEENESIIAFRNHLSIALVKNQFTIIENKFYVSTILEINTECFDFEKYNDKTKFYIHSIPL